MILSAKTDLKGKKDKQARGEGLALSQKLIWHGNRWWKVKLNCFLTKLLDWERTMTDLLEFIGKQMV